MAAFDFNTATTNVNQVLTNGFGSTGNGAFGGTVLLGPTFRVQQLANTRKVQYAMVRMDPSKTRVLDTYIFPISPQALNMQRRSLSNIFETAGAAGNQSVRRIVDLYGLTPTIFTVRGTTGFNQYGTDNFKKGGIDWMLALQAYIENWFNTLGNPNGADTLQFFDFFFGQGWWVVPVGPMIIRQDAQRPLWMYYELTLAGLTRLTSSQVSDQSSAITKSLSQAQSNAANLKTVMAGIVTGAAIIGPYI